MVVLVWLHVVFLFNAGAFWRDEVDSINVASLPSVAEVWANLHSQSFPVLWFVALRSWIRIGPGSTDLGIRFLGLVIGLGLLGVLWRNARAFGQSTPLVSLAVLGFNAAVIRYGDSVRGHGLGMLTGLLALGLVWEVARSPTAWRVAAAAIAAIVAVQCLYYNVAIVAAACAGGLVVALRSGSRRSTGCVVAIGGVSAVSLLPYRHIVEDREKWGGVFRVRLDLPTVGTKIVDAFASTGSVIHWLWVFLVLLAVSVGLYGLTSDTGEEGERRKRDAAIYCGVAILTGLTAYMSFLMRIGYPTQPWYYVTAMALVAGCLDAPLALLARTAAARTTRLVAIVIVIGLVFRPVSREARTRNTNVDLVATRVSELAAKEDLVVINPWYLGLTFDRYFRGTVVRTTVPPIQTSATQRYDLVKQKMISRRAIEPVLEEMRVALSGGHRIFWVGDLFMPEPGKVPEDPPPAPLPDTGWSDAPYYEAWGLQAGYLIQSHAKAAERVEVPVDRAVSPYEDAALYVFSGWWEGR